MVNTYFEIGRIIVEEEQKGKEPAEYGQKILKKLSDRLSKKFGRGFSVDNLENMRRFYLTYSISETVSRKSIGEKSHQDLGQMHMYVNYYDRFVKTKEENKTIGIILCRDKNDAVVEITLPENNKQIFASKYLTVLPSKEELKKLIENKDEE